jgi:uncharacterized protein YlzI (FlbEa/FlbD family)
MKWAEIAVEPYDPINESLSQIYEIGTDTVINDLTYKKILLNGKVQKNCVREDGESVYLHTEEYESDIRLYDFDWQSNSFLTVEYLREEGDGVELLTLNVPSDYQLTYVNSNSYQYHSEGDGIVIRGIGRVSELNRNSSLLGYEIPEIILPGCYYWKVLWINRDGIEIFSSDVSEEWTVTVPTSIQLSKNGESSSPEFIYNIYGQRMTERSPRSGIYIQNGKKFVVK